MAKGMTQEERKEIKDKIQQEMDAIPDQVSIDKNVLVNTIHDFAVLQVEEALGLVHGTEVILHRIGQERSRRHMQQLKDGFLFLGALNAPTYPDDNHPIYPFVGLTRYEECIDESNNILQRPAYAIWTFMNENSSYLELEPKPYSQYKELVIKHFSNIENIKLDEFFPTLEKELQQNTPHSTLLVSWYVEEKKISIISLVVGKFIIFYQLPYLPPKLHDETTFLNAFVSKSDPCVARTPHPFAIYKYEEENVKIATEECKDCQV